MSQDFENRTREVLGESVERLDGRTRSRLTQARHAALEQFEKPKSIFERSWLRTYVPAGATAAAAVLAVILWNGRPPAETVASDPGPAYDMEMLADSEAPDFIADTDELEFYEWAADEIES
jgi:hypothetical protein